MKPFESKFTISKIVEDGYKIFQNQENKSEFYQWIVEKIGIPIKHHRIDSILSSRNINFNEENYTSNWYSGNDLKNIITINGIKNDEDFFQIYPTEGRDSKSLKNKQKQFTALKKFVDTLLVDSPIKQ